MQLCFTTKRAVRLSLELSLSLTINVYSSFSAYGHVQAVRVIMEERAFMVSVWESFPVSVASKLQSYHSSIIYATSVRVIYEQPAQQNNALTSIITVYGSAGPG